MKLSVIIVNYNVKHFLEQALLSVYQAGKLLEMEVFVVDNNSVDDSVRMVRERFPEVKIIANKDNPGFSVANNQAIRQSSGECVLLLNPDTVVEEDTFAKCIAFMDSHPDAGGLGVKMIDGAGKFLPESKRGFPSPFVAFSKTFGLSKLFPKSRVFNRYHLGFLDENQNHEIEVLSGAFLFVRRSVFDKTGLLDETFFMYGEDIDLSYRIVKAGYKNYYLADTTIIHYKGESTKKGSLNYLKVFYNAMIVFARKHFKGKKARLFILMLKLAIYFRAFLALLSTLFRKAYLPVLDAVIIFLGLFFLKNFWAGYHFNDPDYYDQTFLYFNAPLYIAIWLISVYFSGGYDERNNIWRLVRGLLAGTVFLAAVYGFLDLEYRSSRALIILGAIWAILSTVSLRVLLHFVRYGNLNPGSEKPKNMVIVGSWEESGRVRNLLHRSRLQKNIIGIVSPLVEAASKTYLSHLGQLDEIVHIYKIDEIIFCSKDVSAQDIMYWMTKLGPDIEYKIVPQEGLSIIGSSSRNSSGELYTIEIQFRIAHYLHRRNKRLVDFILACFFLLTFPIQIFLVKRPVQFLKNIFSVLINKKSWVGYGPLDEKPADLPEIRQGILSPLDALKVKNLNNHTIQRLNFLYAKDYHVYKDLDIIWKGYGELGSRKDRRASQD